MATFYDEKQPLCQTSEQIRHLKGSSSGPQLPDLPTNNQLEVIKRSNTMAAHNQRHRSPIVGAHLDTKGIIGPYSSTFTAVCKDVQKLLNNLLKNQNQITDGELFSERLMKSMREMMKIVDNRAIFISVFGQHNCGKSTFLNALLGEEYLATSAVNETSIRVSIQHDSQVHPGYCRGDECDHRHKSLICPKLMMNPGTEIVGPRNIRHKLRNINEAVRKVDATMQPSVPSLTLMVSLPLLTYNVPPGWTVSLIDTPGFGEANEHVQQLAEDSVEVSAAYIYLLQTESIGGIEISEMFQSIAEKDPEAFIDGRLIVVITKFDTNYNDHSLGYESGSESDNEECNSGQFKITSLNFVKVEEKTKQNLHDCIQDAIQLVVSPDMILPVCGQWALCGSKLNSYLSFHCDQKDDRHYMRRFKAATEALSKHPKRIYLSIPGAQGQAELETMRQLDPSVVVQHLDQVTGSKCLKEKIQSMVGKCIKLWSLKVKREYRHYMAEAKKKIDKKITELVNKAEAIQTEQKISEAKNHGITSLYSRVRESVTINEDSRLWKKIAENYDEDIRVSRVTEEGKQLVSKMIEEFKSHCLHQFQSTSGMIFGEVQFTQGIGKLLSDTGKELTVKFDRTCSFRKVFDSIVDDVNQMARKCGELDQRARQLCNDLHINTQEFTVIQSSKTKTRSPCEHGVPVLGDLKIMTAIPPVRLSLWTRIEKMIRSILKIERDEGCYSYRSWNDELEKVLRETEDLMQQKCESYFDEIKHKTVEHFCTIATENVDADLIPFEKSYKPLIEIGIGQLEKCLKDVNDKQANLTDKIKDLSDLQCRLEDTFEQEFVHYM